jgi:hypothetical protein
MFEQLTADLAAARNALIEMGKAAFRPAILEFMAAHPEVSAIRWVQGTPGFNDGDPCTFDIHEPEVRLGPPTSDPIPMDDVVAGDDDDEDEDEDDWDDDDDEEFLDTYSLPDDLPNRAQLEADIDALYSVIQSAEEAVQAMFGDGYQITVGRDGVAHVSQYGMD